MVGIVNRRAPVIEHPMLVEGAVEARAYQVMAFLDAMSDSTLLVLPTGYGKTAVQWLMMADVLHRGGSVLLIAPTNGLVDQQRRMAEEMLALPSSQMVVLTGRVPPLKRAEAWVESRLRFATPEVIRNDSVASRIDLSGLDLLILDEAHHATGRHAMAQVGDLLRSDGRARPSVLGVTASPGSTLEGVQEVMRRLHLDRLHVRHRDDAMLIPYAVELAIDDIRLDLPPELLSIVDPIVQLEHSEADRLAREGFLIASGGVTNARLEEARRRISGAIQRQDRRGYDAMRRLTDLRRIHRVVDLLRTQNLTSTRAYLQRAASEEGKRTQRFLGFQAIQDLRRTLRHTEELHPKPGEVCRLVGEALAVDPEGRVLVFAEFRDSVMVLERMLSTVEGARPARFVGQSDGADGIPGMAPKQQLARLEEFRNGTHNVLICTSVGEEGLDVPSATTVILYEPVASAIRMIQRRGRTARRRDGAVKVLIAAGTRDEHVRRASQRREARMVRILNEVRIQLRLPMVINRDVRDHDRFRVRHGRESQTLEAFVQMERGRLLPTIREPEPSPPPGPPQLRPSQIRSPLQMGLEAWMVNDEHVGNRRHGSLLLDHRELSSTVAVHLRQLGVPLEVGTLTTGDYLIGDDILIERKTGKDLAASIRDGRMLAQMRRLAGSNHTALLLLEDPEDLGGSAMRREAIDGLIITLALEFGIPVLPTRDAVGSARLLSRIAGREAARMASMLTPFRRDGRHPVKEARSLTSGRWPGSDEGARMEHRSITQRALMAIPTIGERLALRLTDAFGSIGAVLAAEEHELAEVEGMTVGRIRALTAQRA